ncbi:MAG TPA: FixH family protein [Phycisphaerae bacterium]|nr:FixH family protein [Phycisphaerae bacterium]
MFTPLTLMLPSLHALALRAGPLDFSDPVWLWALLVFIPILYFWKTSRVPATPMRRWVTLALRSLLILALILSLAGTRLVWFNKGICVVFVLDQSQSVPGQARDLVRERLQTEVDKMTKDDRFLVVEFGGDAVLGSLPSSKGQMPPPVKVADPGRTDIGRALRLALASFPQDRQKRIVLFSDGNQNSGDALREARLAAAKDVDVDVFMLSAQQGHEVMVEQVIVPPRVRKDANFNVRAIISSDTPQDVQILITRDGVPLDPITTRLKTGTNVIDLPNQMSEGGYHEFQVTVVPNNPENDTFAANNTGYAFTNVEAPGRVLLIRGKPDIQTQLYQALQSTGIPVDVGTVNSLPTSVKDFARYDSVMLDDVDAGRLAPTQMSELARWVKEFGGGLVLIGGDSSFGPGGYKGTPLEDVSPVEMDVKREKHLASLAIVIVNDKSGSMGMPIGGGREKMDLANEGSCEVLKLLDATDYAMIGAVDTEVKWMFNGSGAVHPLPMNARNKSEMQSLTRSVKAGGGGIYCETALAAAYDLVNDPKINAMAKHVIMFADLQDSEQQENCVRMADDNFRHHGVTTSVIGMGTEKDPDAQFQKDVARAGHGRWAAAEDVTHLPRLFAKEAFLVSRRAFVENPKGIQPTVYNSPLLEGFLTPGAGGGGGVPKVYGYVGTTLKPRASLVMHGNEPDDPLLANWSTGLGKCVAYTSDSTARWGRDWIGWNGYSKFWSQIVRWVARSNQNNGLTTTTVMDGNEGRVVVDAVDDTGKPINNLQLKADVILPDATAASKDVPLEQIGPGRYQGHFSASQRGTYLVSVADGKSNDALATGGGVLSYPPEFRDLKPNAGLLHAIADTTGGQYLSQLDAGGGIFTPKPDPVRTFWPLWETLLILVASGLVADVAWRRLNVADWFRARHHVSGMPVIAQSVAAAKGGSLGAFRSIKSSRRDVDTQRESLRDRVEALAKAAPSQTTPIILPDEPTAPASKTESSAKEEPAAGYTNRLMSAKKRAADQIREQSDNKP